eukprot:XP_016664395.1 PREDICTED: uncharacterized protein LOC107885294 [Acyrthosiphon pisum]
MELKTLTGLNVVMLIICVKLQDTDAAITNRVVTTKKVKTIRAGHFGNVLKNSSGDYCAAHSSEQLLLRLLQCILVYSFIRPEVWKPIVWFSFGSHYVTCKLNHVHRQSSSSWRTHPIFLWILNNSGTGKCNVNRIEISKLHYKLRVKMNYGHCSLDYEIISILDKKFYSNSVTNNFFLNFKDILARLYMSIL